jgi:hypothetical protein
MIEVRNITVRSFDLDHLDIFWEVADTDEDLSRYSFFLQRSIDGQEGPYEQIAGPFDNSYRFRDPDVHRLYRWREYYYRLRVTCKDTDWEGMFGPEWVRAKPDLMCLEMQRRNYLLFQEFAGRPCLLLPALTFGQRCPVCMDIGPKGNFIGRETQSNCKTCFGMGYVGGFASPIIVYGQVDPSSKSVQLLDTMEKAADQSTGKFGPYPHLKPKDVIVDPENARWLVDKVNFTKKNGAIVHQVPELRKVSEGHVVYAVPVNMDAIDEFAPAREFTRPMTLDNSHGH